MVNYIEIIKRMVSDGQVTQDAAEKYFPELKESEDEKIRKEITEFFKNFSKTGTFNAILDVAKWIAWLEKQGEQKPSKIHRIGVSAFTDTIQAIRTVYDEESEYELIEYLKSLVERKEQKPAWSEEDEKIKEAFIKRILENYNGCSYINGISEDVVIDWFKSLKDRVTTQPKQKLSEKGTKIIKELIKFLDLHLGTSTAPAFSVEAIKKWITFLETRYEYKQEKAQPIEVVEWSEEDKEMIIKICQNLYDYPRIKSPYDDESFNEAQKEVQFIKSIRPQKQYENIYDIGDTITDGTSTFIIKDIIDEHYIADDGGKVCFYVAHKYYRQVVNCSITEP